MSQKKHYRVRHHSHRYGALLSFIDGLEGGFAIFAGIVAGLSFTSVNRAGLIVTALVGITVNAINAATIRYSTEHYYDELDGREKRSPFRAYFIPSVIEFAIYMIVSCFSLLPLLFLSELTQAVIWMIATCLLVLFAAGALRGRLMSGHHWLRDGCEVMLGGTVMIIAGTLAGWLLARVFGAH